MAIAFCFTPSSSSAAAISSTKFNPLRPIMPSLSSSSPALRLSTTSLPSLSHRTRNFRPVLFATGGGDGGFNGGSGGGGDGDDEEEDNAGGKNKSEAMMVMKEAGRSLDSLPKDLAAAIHDGRIPGSVVDKYFELEKSRMFAWLLQFAGFRERLLADDLFLFKVFMECGVGLFTKTAAEYQKRKDNFFNELEVVFADVVMAIIADFMLVYLPAPTVSLRPPLGLSAGAITKFFHGCPDNAFQTAISGTTYSMIQRIGAVVRNGSKLFVVGTASSLPIIVPCTGMPRKHPIFKEERYNYSNCKCYVGHPHGQQGLKVGTAVTNALINAKKAVSSEGEVENVPIVSTSLAYGVYMAVSSNLRYQVLAGVIEQRMLEPLLHQHKLMLSAICFAIRTGNTFLGSLLWVDYARLIGIQKAH